MNPYKRLMLMLQYPECTFHWFRLNNTFFNPIVFVYKNRTNGRTYNYYPNTSTWIQEAEWR